MVRTLRWLIIVVLLMAPAGAAHGESVQSLPTPTGYVNDFAGVLSPETRQQVEDLCTEVDSLAHAQIAVVTIKTIDPDKSGATPSIEEFATALEDKWKVGAKGTDRGILMLLVMNPRRGRIEVGYGLEGILNDAKVGDIGREMAPYAQRGDYNQAVPLGVREIASVVMTDAGVSPGATGAPAAHVYHREPQSHSQLSFTQLLVIGGIILVVFLVLCATGHVGMAFWLLLNLIGGGGGGRDDDRGGGGGGFGGFGGGGSGGGGASGDF